MPSWPRRSALALSRSLKLRLDNPFRVAADLVDRSQELPQTFRALQQHRVMQGQDMPIGPCRHGQVPDHAGAFCRVAHVQRAKAGVERDPLGTHRGRKLISPESCECLRELVDADLVVSRFR